jgi:hypothetical protein
MALFHVPDDRFFHSGLNSGDAGTDKRFLITFRMTASFTAALCGEPQTG